MEEHVYIPMRVRRNIYDEVVRGTTNMIYREVSSWLVRRLLSEDDVDAFWCAYYERDVERMNMLLSSLVVTNMLLKCGNTDESALYEISRVSYAVVDEGAENEERLLIIEVWQE